MVIPEGWKKVKIKDITEVFAGGTPDTNVPEYWGGNIPWMNSGDLKFKFICKVDGRITSEGMDSSSTHFIPIGSVLVGLAGQGKTRGTVAYNKIELCTNQSIAAIYPNQLKFDSLYLYYFMDTQYALLRELSSGGGGRGGLNKNIILEYEIYLPIDISEQTAIATALSDMDDLIASLEKLLAKKQGIKQGAMQDLLTGRKRLKGFSGKWRVCKLGEIADIKDGTHQTPHYVDDGIPFYSVENVSSNDFQHTKFITESEYRKLTASYHIEHGDVLMTRIGSVGVCKYVNWHAKSAFYVSLALLKFKDKDLALYFSFLSKTMEFKKQVEINSLQFAVPMKINLGKITDILIKFPKDKMEQRAIATLLSDMDDEITALQQKLAKYRQIKQGMMAELLTGRIRLKEA